MRRHLAEVHLGSFSVKCYSRDKTIHRSEALERRIRISCGFSPHRLGRSTNIDSARWRPVCSVYCKQIMRLSQVISKAIKTWEKQSIRRMVYGRTNRGIGTDVVGRSTQRVNKAHVAGQSADCAEVCFKMCTATAISIADVL